MTSKPYSRIPRNTNQWLKQERKEAEEFYNSINIIANKLKFQDRENIRIFTKRFQDNIPSIYLNADNIKSVYIKSVRERIDYIDLPKIRPHDSQTIIIHVTQGILKISCDDNYSRELCPYNSYSLNMLDRTLYLRTTENITNFALVAFFIPDYDQKSTTSSRSFLNEKPIKHINPTRIVINPENVTKLPENIIPIPVPKHNIPISYIRSIISEQDLQKRILFLDAEFVSAGREHVPGSVTILDYEGRVIIDQIIKPENEVTNYFTPITGFTKQMIDRGLSQRTLQYYLNEILVGKILIGADLTLDIKALKINKENLLGIRDLSTSKTLRKRMNTHAERIGLASMARYFWNIEIHQDIHSSLEDANMIRSVYALIHDTYEDDIIAPDSPLHKDNIDLLENIPEVNIPEDTSIVDEEMEPFSEDVEMEFKSNDEVSIYDITDEDINLELFTTPLSSPKNETTEDNSIKIPNTILLDGKRFVPRKVIYEEEASTEFEGKITRTITYRI